MKSLRSAIITLALLITATCISAAQGGVDSEPDNILTLENGLFNEISADVDMVLIPHGVNDWSIGRTVDLQILPRQNDLILKSTGAFNFQDFLTPLCPNVVVPTGSGMVLLSSYYGISSPPPAPAMLCVIGGGTTTTRVYKLTRTSGSPNALEID